MHHIPLLALLYLYTAIFCGALLLTLFSFHCTFANGLFTLFLFLYFTFLIYTQHVDAFRASKGVDFQFLMGIYIHFPGFHLVCTFSRSPFAVASRLSLLIVFFLCLLYYY